MDTCAQCGFTYCALDRRQLTESIRFNGGGCAQRLGREAADLRRRRAPDEWSALEYACHVRDVYALAQVRLGLMLDQDRPTFANWDQDATAVEDRYDRQDPARVAEQVLEQAAGLARLLERVEGDDWERSGRRSDGAVFTVGSFARYVIHDPVHHVWDVTGARP